MPSFARSRGEVLRRRSAPGSVRSTLSVASISNPPNCKRGSASPPGWWSSAKPQKLWVPARPGNRQLIVGQHVGALLRLAPARGDHHRDLGDAELPGGEYPGVARDQAAVLAHQRRRRPAPLLDACRDRGDLGIRVGPGIFRVRDQPIDRPPLDPVRRVRRPRSLISVADSRAGARAPREGAVAEITPKPVL